LFSHKSEQLVFDSFRGGEKSPWERGALYFRVEQRHSVRLFLVEKPREKEVGAILERGVVEETDHTKNTNHTKCANHTKCIEKLLIVC